MEPHQLKPGETLPAPASYLAGQEEEAQRARLIGEWREHLGAKQRAALEEEGPYAPFKTRMSLELVKSLTPEEREELAIHEQREYDRLKPLAASKGEQRRQFIAAGGDGADFDEMWESGGKNATIAQLADDRLDRASRASSAY